MAKTVYFVKASWFKAWDWCPRKVYLEAKYGLREEPGLALAKWIIKHDFFCNYKEAELRLFPQNQELPEQEIVQHLIQETMSTLDSIIARNENKIAECIKNDRAKGESVPAPSEFIKSMETSLPIKLKELVESRAPMLKELPNLKFLREENPYSRDTRTYGFLKNNKEGIGSRPDFVIFIKSGYTYRATVLDVKPKLSEDRKGEFLQNTTGYLAVEANLEYLKQKTDIEDRVIMAANHWIFEYDTGNEASYPIDPYKSLLFERAKKLREGKFPRDEYKSWKCERCGIATQCADPKYT